MFCLARLIAEFIFSTITVLPSKFRIISLYFESHLTKSEATPITPETPFELIRYYDMRRWKIMDKLNGLVLDPLYTNIIPAWSKKHEYLPLPQGQIDFSNGILVQNPNY